MRIRSQSAASINNPDLCGSDTNTKAWFLHVQYQRTLEREWNADVFSFILPAVLVIFCNLAFLLFAIRAMLRHKQTPLHANNRLLSCISSHSSSKNWIGWVHCKEPIPKILHKYSHSHSPNFHLHVSVSDLYITAFDLPILLQEICGTILGIYKSLTDTWMWKLGPRPRNSQKINT